jgi:outer membrane lipoprotein-sorting protein
MTIIAAVTALALAQAGTSIQSYVQSNLDDATFTARILKGDQRELRKINDSFGESYRFETTTIRFKEPFKMRLEANVEDTKILYILNGPMQYIKIPRARINSKTNLSDKPGRRQTPLDFGLLTPSLFDGLFQAKFVRMDRASGDAVFDLTYPARLDDTTRHRIWVDPEKKYVTKREWYNQSGRQLATFYYENPKNEKGVWLPTKLTVKNVDGRIAGVTAYDAIKVNTGLADSLFQG